MSRDLAAFYHGTARLPDGWIMRRGCLDSEDRDIHGWNWGPGEPVFVLQPEGIDDTLSVRAPCPVIAISMVTIDGWPPRNVKRYRWEYSSP